MYYLNQKRASCMRPYIHCININIFLYLYYYSSTSAIPSSIFMYNSSYSTAYKKYAAMLIVWEYQLLINHRSIMTCSVTSGTTRQYFFVKSTHGIWVYHRATRHDLNWEYLFLLKTHFESIMRLFGGIFFILDFLHTPLFIM